MSVCLAFDVGVCFDTSSPRQIDEAGAPRGDIGADPAAPIRLRREYFRKGADFFRERVARTSTSSVFCFA